MSGTMAELVADRQRLKTDIKKLSAELEHIENQLKTIAKDAFADTTPATRVREHQGVRVYRKLLRTMLKTSTPKRTAAYLATLDVDVFSESMVQKAKLDALGAEYGDGFVKIYGELVPGLKCEPVWGFEYTAMGTMTAADLDDE